jgi:hypothetical protein
VHRIASPLLYAARLGGACAARVLGVASAACGLVACTTFAPAATGSTSPDAELAFVDVAVVDVVSGRTVPGRTVLIAGDRIQAIGPAGEVRVPAGARVVAGAGLYLAPGLIDTHAHAWLDAPYDSLAAPGGYLANGVTGVRFMSSTNDGPAQLRLRSAAAAGAVLSPRIYVSGTVSHRVREQLGAASIVELVRMLAAQGYDGLKILYLGRDDALAVIGEARRLGMAVYGHTYRIVPGSDEVEDFTGDALRAGISGLVHVQDLAPPPTTAPTAAPPAAALPAAAGGTPPPPAAAPPAAGGTPPSPPHQWRWLATDSAAMQALIADMLAHRAWLEPTLFITRYFPQPERYRAHPANAYLPVPWDEYRTWFGDASPDSLLHYDVAFRAMQQFVARFQQAGGLVVAGTDNSPAPFFGLHDELELLVQAGLAPIAAPRAATRNAAHVLGWLTSPGAATAPRGGASLCPPAAAPRGLRPAPSSGSVPPVLRGRCRG